MRQLAALLLALSLAAAAAADQDAWCKGDSWVPLPELEPGLVDLPDPALYAAQKHFERYFGADVGGWACPADALSVAADGCEQAGSGSSRFWLRLHLACPESNEAAEVEALVAVLPGGKIEVDLPRVVLAGVEQAPILMVDPGSALYENPFETSNTTAAYNGTEPWRDELVPLTQLMLEPPSDVVYAREPPQPCPEGTFSFWTKCYPCSTNLPHCKQERERAQREAREASAAAHAASADDLAAEPSAEQLAAVAMAEEMAALRLENSQLAYAASLMEKTLEFRQAVLALAQTLRVAPGLPPPAASLLPAGHEAAVAAAHQRVVAAAEQLPPQHDVEAFAAQFAGQLPKGILVPAVPAAPCCAPLPARGASEQLGVAHLQPAAPTSLQSVEGSMAPAAGPAAAALPAAAPAGGAEASGSVGCLLEEGGGASGGEWILAAQVAAVHALPAQQQQQQQQQQLAAAPDDGWGPRGVPLAIGGGRVRSPQQQQQQQQQRAAQLWQQAVPSDGWGIPGVPLAIGGGRPAAPALPAALAQPPVPQAGAERPLLRAPAVQQQDASLQHLPQLSPEQPEQPPPQQQPQPQQQPLLDDPGDGWGPRGMPLLLGGSGRGRSSVLAQVLATCKSQAACSEVFSAEGRALQALGVPPPNNPAIRRRVEAVEDVAGITRLQRRLLGTVRDCWPAAAAAHFVPGSPARQALEAAAVEMSSYFWHLAMLKPQLLNAYMLATLPPPSKDMSAQWHNVALDSMPLLADGEIVALRDAYQRYAQRMAVAAVGVRPIAQQLQALAGSSPSVDLVRVAAQHTQVGELASRVHSACEQQYLATMGLLLDMQRAVNPVVRAFWRIAAGNCTPDHPAILSEVLRLHQQQQERLATPASSAGSPCTS
ncbi:hypothetical protein C2E21_0662 [Chlorella sorokiniana]|uniref:Uncharacterized protein n=1 Tax=Chlorella sorokiniana TaxID=3076 RepID=A0A2P6U434_CHLSO|nr:hypothetical protein C2E21_0662 [Chlorella sorokiniana]|eukprot:PRW61087.1 hypothetical protein C2E21_0662 [Chlorella sorokiniana]